MSSPLRILVVDQRSAVTEAIARRLAAEPDIDARSGRGPFQHLMSTITCWEPQVVLISSGQHDRSELRLPGALRDALLDVSVVVLAGRSELERVAEAMRTGVAGWVPAEAPIHVLLDAARAVAAGRMWLPPAHLKQLVGLLTGTQRDSSQLQLRIAKLTPRETDVLRLLLRGNDALTAARALGLSSNTVRVHIRQILTKLDAHSVLEAVALARRTPIGRRQPAESGSFTGSALTSAISGPSYPTVAVPEQLLGRARARVPLGRAPS